MYDYLSVNDTNLPPILHRLRDIALEMSKIAIFCYLYILRLNPLSEGFPLDDLRKIFSECQRMAVVPNGIEKLAKKFNRPSRLHERYRETTNRRTGDSI